MRQRRFDLTRLTPGDVVAVLAALALLFAMAGDWYSTTLGEAARQVERTAETEGAESGVIGRALGAEAGPAAELQERNAWQADGTLDRVILVALLLTVALVFAAAALRAAGRRWRTPMTPSTLAALAALAAAALVIARLIDQPGLDARSTVKGGLAFGLAALGGVAFGAALAMRRERDTGEAEDRGEPDPPPPTTRRRRPPREGTPSRGAL